MTRLAAGRPQSSSRFPPSSAPITPPPSQALTPVLVAGSHHLGGRESGRDLRKHDDRSAGKDQPQHQLEHLHQQILPAGVEDGQVAHRRPPAQSCRSRTDQTAAGGRFSRPSPPPQKPARSAAGPRTGYPALPASVLLPGSCAVPWCVLQLFSAFVLPSSVQTLVLFPIIFDSFIVPRETRVGNDSFCRKSFFQGCFSCPDSISR